MLHTQQKRMKQIHAQLEMHENARNVHKPKMHTSLFTSTL